MQHEVAEQIAAQEAAFAALITTPPGVVFERDEFGGVPVEWTIPVG